MKTGSSGWWCSLRSVFVDPPTACRVAAVSPAPGKMLATLTAVTLAAGLATLPRQLGLLRLGLPVTGDALIDSQHEAIREMVTRLIIIDRLVPQPTVLVAGLLLLLVAEPALMLARDRRRALLAVAVLGLAPLLLDRIGQLAITYVVSPPVYATPGYAMTVPHQFATGPVLFWLGSGESPQWINILDSRVNLISAGCVALWSVGLRHLDGGCWKLWHFLLPAACLVGAGLVTWALAPVVVPMLIF